MGDGVTSLRWRDCDLGECASVAVPVDWAQPQGPRVDLKLARGSTAKSGQKIGTLFVNPGGPGAPGRDFASYVAASLPDAITNRFDVVAWDPRGTGASAPVECGRKLDYMFTPDSAPDSPEELTSLENATKRFVDACVQRSGSWLQHISTDDTVQDLDALRAAVGDRTLTYLGLSYGTFLGAKYAERFPDRVRALILDGAVDPSLSPQDLTITQAQGFDASLAAFMADCARRPSCAFHHGGNPRFAYDALRDAIDAQPIRTRGQEFGPTQFDLGVSALLYSGANAYSTLAEGLRALEGGSPGPMVEAANLYLGRDGS
ncbi:MAG: alpha/beta fold hydrolase, partial [Acidimicrobiia bacterium]|nr:alpha/beta fold hydrolase [Acidimicrobiia bacterium]